MTINDDWWPSGTGIRTISHRGQVVLNSLAPIVGIVLYMQRRVKIHGQRTATMRSEDPRRKTTKHLEGFRKCRVRSSSLVKAIILFLLKQLILYVSIIISPLSGEQESGQRLRGGIRIRDTRLAFPYSSVKVSGFRDIYKYNCSGGCVLGPSCGGRLPSRVA